MSAAGIELSARIDAGAELGGRFRRIHHARFGIAVFCVEMCGIVRKFL